MGRHAASPSSSPLDGHAAYGAALGVFVAAAAPWVDAQLAAVFPGKDWKAALAARDQAKTGYSHAVDMNDPRRVLRLLRDEYPAFNPRLTRTQTSYAHLALDVANSWAHAVTLEPYRARRGIEHLADLLLSLSMLEAADELASLLVALGETGAAPEPESEQPMPDDVDDAAEEDDESDGEGVVSVAAGATADRQAPSTGDANDTVEYRAASWQPRHPVTVLDSLSEPWASAVVRDEIAEVVRAEAPILLNRLLTIVGHRCGLGRVQGPRIDSLRPHVPPTLIRHAPNHDVVVWSDAETPETFTSYRIPAAGSRRPIRTIPYEELRNAMVDLCRAEPGGYPPGTLAWVVNAEFGGQRLKGATKNRLQGVIDAAVAEGTLTSHDGLIRSAEQGS